MGQQTHRHLGLWRQSGFLVVFAALVLSNSLPAQTYPGTRLFSLSLSGAKDGTTVEVTLGGADLEGVAKLQFSHPGIKADLVSGPTSEEKPKNPPTPAVAKFKVTVEKGTPVGNYEVRAIGDWGVSNPRVFVVGDLEEIQEKEPNNDVAQAQKVELNITVNGTISQNVDVDYFKLSGKKGQHILIHCAANAIDSRLTPFIQVFDGTGKQLVSNRDYRERTAVADCVLPADGEYFIRLCEFAYLAGGADYFYRLTIAATPWIDAAYPPVVEAGKPTTITLYGRNLPGGEPDPKAMQDGRPLEKVTVKVPTPKEGRVEQRLLFRDLIPARSGGLDGFEYRIKNDHGSSNAVLLTGTQTPVVLDNEDNDTPEKAQEVPAPCEICGRIEKRGDRDWYVFEAKQNDTFTLEGYADRLGAPVDLFFRIRRAGASQGGFTEVDENADIPPVFGRFFAQTDDPKSKFVAPADGKYELMVSSRTADALAGPRHLYRLSIRKEKPDFRLVLVGNTDPGVTGCTVHKGSSQDMQVICYRTDGFAGEVALTADGLPAGVSCPPQSLGPNQRDTALVFTAGADAADWTGEIKIQGKAVINGEEVVRAARPACLVWPTSIQQNVPAVSRLGDSLWLAVRKQGAYSLETSVQEMSVPPGGAVDLKVKINRQSPDMKAQVQLTRLSGPVQTSGQSINLPNINIGAGQAEATVRFNIPNNTAPGNYNLVFRGTAQFPFNKDPNAKQKQNITATAVSNPVRLTVFTTLGELTVSKPEVSLKKGGQAEVLVKVNRKFGYKGDFKIQLVTPKGFQEVTAPVVTIPAGATEAKLILKAPANAKPGSSPNVLVKANGTPDAKLTVTVLGEKGDAPVLEAETKTIKLVAESAEGWKYHPAANVQGDRWRSLKFEDKGWQTAKAPIGYGEEEIAKRNGTMLKDDGQNFIFRKVIDIPDDLATQKGVTYRLNVASDDTAVVYINGEMVDEDPEADHEFMYWNREIDVPAKHFLGGKNVIAVLVKNKAGSSDMFFDLELKAQAPGKTAPDKTPLKKKKK